MSYYWTLAGLIEKPICKISLNQLLGEVEIITKMTKYQKYYPTQISASYKFLNTNYFIHKHSILERTIEVFGVTLTHNEKTICLSQDGYTFLEPEYRGQGLGAELLAEFYTSHPEIMIKRLEGSTKKLYTAAGIISIKRAYDLMIKRGAILGA